MPTLEERRKMAAADGASYGQNGEFITFKQEGETRIIRFLFTDASSIESTLKYPLVKNEATGRWEEDNTQKGSWKVMFNCVEYDKGGVNPRRVRWELSEYLYNEYLSPYVEKDVPASKNVWEIKVRRPRTMDVSYIAFRVDEATDVNYPTPTTASQSATQPVVSKPTYAKSAAQISSQPAEVSTAPTAAPATDAPATTPKKSKYF